MVYYGFNIKFMECQGKKLFFAIIIKLKYKLKIKNINSKILN